MTKMSVRAYSLASTYGYAAPNLHQQLFRLINLVSESEDGSGNRGAHGLILFLLPIMIERYNLVSLRKCFQHETEDYLVVSEDGKRLNRRNISLVRETNFGVMGGEGADDTS